jgi:hypothetical protein
MANGGTAMPEVDERKLAASTIQVLSSRLRQLLVTDRGQRNYRGYRSRRQINGHNMDAASRWVEVIDSFESSQSTD